MKLQLRRPLVFFDLETTGVNIGTDRIVEISMVKIMPDQTEIVRTHRVNPCRHIPIEASRIHGIYDKDVQNEPDFKTLAPEVAAFLKDCDLAGYNLLKFDVPLLMEEFMRVDFDFSLRGVKIVDVQNIFHKMEPRTLSAAYRFYCGERLENAHTAEADTIATLRVLEAQLDRYKDTPYIDKDEVESFPVVNDVDKLAAFSTGGRNVDLAGHIVLNDNDEEVFAFGKHKGETVRSVFRKERNYYDWMMKAEFPLYTKKVITQIYEAEYLKDFGKII
ncbi:MAG: 3'-5' exonuclease [Bacteroidales bacterium]|nr:3'-5' exonuclease [Bacteroidales bacterium]